MARSEDGMEVDEAERLDEPTAVDGEATATERGSTDAGESLTDRLGGVFSLKALLLSTALVTVGVVAGGAIPLVGTLGSLGGLFAATFGSGLLFSEQRYLETAIASGGVVGLSFAVSLLSTGVLPVGMEFFREYGLAFGAVGVALGAVVGVAGHYFGRDLRDGLTREVD